MLRHFVELFSGTSDGRTNLVNVMVQLTTEAAHAVRSHELPAELREAEKNLRPLELALEPLHPGAGDSSLATWFRMPVYDEASAERVAGELRASPAVASAYVEPLSAPPA